VKLLIVILSDRDCERVLQALVEKEFRVTRVASTGGFLRRGNSTLFIGISSERVDEAISVVRGQACEPMVSGHRRATIFVLNVAHFEQL
jgi:uncharacterized protein YaaQ